MNDPRQFLGSHDCQSPFIQRQMKIAKKLPNRTCKSMADVLDSNIIKLSNMRIVNYCSDFKL